MTEQYSLWLMPSGETYDKLEVLIRDLSKKFNSHYFPPHITLLGKLKLTEKEMTSKTQALSYLLSPFQISLENIDYSEDYFRSIYIKAKKDPSLLDANVKARKIFDMEKNEEYMPHLSLLYSNITQENKESTIKSIPDNLNLSFNIKQIHIYSTTGPVSEWFKLRSFDLR